MKTMNTSLIHAASKALVLILLSTTFACSNQAKDKSTTGVEPPQIDIHTAVITGNIEAVKQHIQAGTDINEKDPFGGSSPLISAAVFGKPEIAKFLIDAGANLNFQNNDGSTALISAAFFCRPEIVKMLLDKGADKSIKNAYGATAYDSVAGPFADIKSSYDMMGTILAPAGLILDYTYVEKTRPEIAAMLN